MVSGADSAGEEAAAVVVVAAEDLETATEEIAAVTAIVTVEIVDLEAVVAAAAVASEVVVAVPAAAVVVVARNEKATGSARIVAIRTLPGVTSAIAVNRPNPRAPAEAAAAVVADTEAEAVVAGEDSEVVEAEVVSEDEEAVVPCGEVTETATSARDPTKTRTRDCILHITNFNFKLSCSH